MAEEAFSIRVSAGLHDRVAVPVAFPAPKGTHDGTCSLLEPGGIPAQAEAGEILFILPHLAAGKTIEYRVRPVELEPVLEETTTPGRVSFSENGIPVTDYVFSVESGLQFKSKPYFHPLSVAGIALTRAVPDSAAKLTEEELDHQHHRGLWSAHGDVNGEDIWNEYEGQYGFSGYGFQRHAGFARVHGGPVCAGLTAGLDWEDRGRRKSLRETRGFRVWRSVRGGHLLDLSTRLEATGGPVRLGDTKEGGMCAIRMRPELQGDHGGLITNSVGGRTEAECWGQRAEWCDYSGRVEGKEVGVAVLDHPTGFRFPTHWHVRDYGLFAANPFALKEYGTGHLKDGSHVIPAGGSISFRYRIYLHQGNCAEAGVRERWVDFAMPPKVEVLE